MDNSIVLTMQQIMNNKALAPPSSEPAGPQHFSPHHLNMQKAPDPVNTMLGRAHVSALCRHAGPVIAAQILRDSGMQAGEDYAYQYMDFEDSFSRFASDLCKVHCNTGLPHWEVTEYSADTGDVQLCLWPWKGCRAQEHDTSSLLCEYMQGFAQGIFTAYAGREYTLSSQCGCCVANGHKPAICRYRLCPCI